MLEHTNMFNHTAVTGTPDRWIAVPDGYKPRWTCYARTAVGENAALEMFREAAVIIADQVSMPDYQRNDRLVIEYSPALLDDSRIRGAVEKVKKAGKRVGITCRETYEVRPVPPTLNTSRYPNEVISGPKGSGKSRRIRELLIEEHKDPTVESWLIDPGLCQPLAGQKAARSAHTCDEIRELFAALLADADDRARILGELGVVEFIARDPRHDLPLISLTIEDADHVLKDPQVVPIAEQIAGVARKVGIRLRVAVQDTTLDNFGGSVLLRSAFMLKPVELTFPGQVARDDAQVTAGMEAWAELTAREQREVFLSAYRAAVSHQRTDNIDHLTRFAESLHTMVEVAAIPGLRDKIRESRNHVPVPASDEAVEELLASLDS
jgi:hypothetical protein